MEGVKGLGVKTSGRFWRFLDSTLEVAAKTLLLTTLVLMTLQIVMRYFFDSPLTWSEEIAKYSMVWMVFLGAVTAVKEKAHICVDLVVGSFPKKLRDIVSFFTKILSLIFLGVMVYYGIVYVKMNVRNYSLITGVNMGFVYSIIPFSGLLMFINLLRVFKED